MKNARREIGGRRRRACSSDSVAISSDSLPPNAVECLIVEWVVPQLVGAYMSGQNIAEGQDNLESVCDA